MPSATNPEQIATVLVVDDDIDARERLRGVFEKAGYRALSAARRDVGAAPASRKSLAIWSCSILRCRESTGWRSANFCARSRRPANCR